MPPEPLIRGRRRRELPVTLGPAICPASITCGRPYRGAALTSRDAARSGFVGATGALVSTPVRLHSPPRRVRTPSCSAPRSSQERPPLWRRERGGGEFGARGCDPRRFHARWRKRRELPRVNSSSQDAGVSADTRRLDDRLYQDLRPPLRLVQFVPCISGSPDGTGYERLSTSKAAGLSLDRVGFAPAERQTGFQKFR